jgi:hypothetical protein
MTPSPTTLGQTDLPDLVVAERLERSSELSRVASSRICLHDQRRARHFCGM